MSLTPNPKLYSKRGHRIATEPAVEPVTATELRDQLRETATGLPDAEAESIIAQARQLIEQHTGLALITQSWTLAFDQWPSAKREPWWDGVRGGAISELNDCAGFVDLPRYPLQSVDTITVYDSNGDGTSVTIASVFDVDTFREPGRIGLKFGATWPVAYRPTNGVVIVYTAGYGDAGSDVPAALKRAVLQASGYLYANRGDACCESNALAAVQGMLGQYKAARL